MCSMGVCFIRADVADDFWICYFLVSNVTSSFGIKYIVLVPSIQFCTPLAKRTNSLANDFSKFLCPFP